MLINLFHAEPAELADFVLIRIPYTDYAVAGIRRRALVSLCQPNERKSENGKLTAYPLHAHRLVALTAPAIAGLARAINFAYSANFA